MAGALGAALGLSAWTDEAEVSPAEDNNDRREAGPSEAALDDDTLEGCLETPWVSLLSPAIFTVAGAGIPGGAEGAR